MDLWRISNHRSLSGAGGMRYSARWHTRGRRVVYLAESAAGAMIEVLVHLELEPGELPPGYTLLRIDVPGDLKIEKLQPARGKDWKTDERITRRLGDAWLEAASSAMAWIPSAILPRTANYLLNPAHPDAGRVKIRAATRETFDVRLLRSIRS